MLLKPAVLVCLLAELGLVRQVRRQDNVAPSPILSSINIPPPLSTGTGAVAPISGGPTGIFLNTSVPATAPQLSTVTEVATITSTLSNNVTTTEVITTERTVTASAAPVIQQPQVIIISQVTFFTFISALGGAPPAVQQGDQGGFVVGGQQFGQFQSACNAACGMQFTQCQSIAGQNFQISQCQTQLIACQNAAKTATVTVSVPTTVTQTVLLPNGPISGDAGGVPSGIAEEGGSVITTTTLPPDAGATVGTGGVSFITVTATPGAPPSQTAVPKTDVLTTTLPANPDQPDATPVVSVITVTRQPGSEPSQSVEGGASGQGGSVVTSAVVSTLPPQSEGGQPIVSTVYVTATVSGGVPAASEVVSSADAVVTTLPAQSEGGEPIVSTIYVSAPPPAPTNEPGASEQAGSVVTSAVVSTLPAESGLPPVVSTIYVTATVSGSVPIASEAVSSVDAIASSSAVVTTLPAQSEGGEPVVSTVFVSVPPAAPTDEPGASEQGSVVTSAIETTLPAQSEGGSAIVSTVYVTATVPASGPAASEVVSRPAQQPPNPNEPKTSVITMTLAPPSGTPVYSLVTITIQPTAGPSGTAPVQTELSTSALTSTIPAEGTTPPRVTTVYITAQPPAPTSAPPPRVITVTVGSLTGVVTVSDAQSTASATTVASALPSAVTGGGNGGNGGDGGNGGNGGSDNGGNNSSNGGNNSGNGGGVGQEGSGSCPSAVTVTETVSACPTAPVTSVLTQTVSVVPTAAAAAKRAEKPAAADEVKRDAVRHPRRHGHAFGLW